MTSRRRRRTNPPPIDYASWAMPILLGIVVGLVLL